MEIPVIESGLNRIQSPNLLLHLRTLWTWVALIVAAVATFNSLIRRSKRVLLRFCKGKTIISHPPSSTYSVDDNDDVSCCSSRGDDDGDEDEELSSDSEKDFGNFEGTEGQKPQNGESGYNFTWPDLSRDGSVVKFWDGLGLGLGFDRCCESISLLDLGREEILRSFRWGSDKIPAVHLESPGKVLSAGKGVVKVWDPRAIGEVASATWQSGIGRLVGVGDENNEVYLGDDVGRLRVVDLRNVTSPLAETWWVAEETDGAVTVGDGDGLVSWCRNAARCITRL